MEAWSGDALVVLEKVPVASIATGVRFESSQARVVAREVLFENMDGLNGCCVLSL